MTARILAFDTETTLIRPALLAPELVCITWRERGQPAQIAHHLETEGLLQGWLSNPDITLVGHNVAFDAAVVIERFPALRRPLFEAYDAGRITDTMLRQQLLDIAAGRMQKGGQAKRAYTLEILAKRCANIELQKDAWRLSYSEFLHTPLKDWPSRAREVQAEHQARLPEFEAAVASAKKGTAEAKAAQERLAGVQSLIASAPEQCLKYPLDDARATLAVFEAQEKHKFYLEDQFRQTQAAFALYLSSAWGLRTDPLGVEILRRETEEELEECEVELIEAGLVRPNGVRDTKAAAARMLEVCKAGGIRIPRTKSHETKPGAHDLCDQQDACTEHVSLDTEACEASEDDLLIRYAELSKLKKVLSNDLEALQRGVQYPLHTRYGLAETGRTTSSKPPLQNWARGRKCKTCDGTGEIAEAK